MLLTCGVLSVGDKVSQSKTCANKLHQIINSRPLWVHYVTNDVSV